MGHCVSFLLAPGEVADLSAHPHASVASDKTDNGSLQRGLLDVFSYSRRALMLVWTTNKGFSISLAALTLLAGVLPAGIAYIGSLIVDAVIHAADLHRRTGSTSLIPVVRLVAFEAALVAATSIAQRGISLAQSLLRAQLGQRVNVMILEKALTLDLTQFEDSEFYDKLTRARREASSRPLSLVMRTFGLVQNLISLVTYGAPVSNDTVALAFKQSIGANEALRTGAYAKTLTFTLSTTAP